MDDDYDDAMLDGLNFNEILVPIGFDACLSLLLQSIPNANEVALAEALKRMVELKKEGVSCQCDQPMWTIGSAIAGKPVCNTCYVKNVMASYLNYEIDEVCSETIISSDLNALNEIIQEPHVYIDAIRRELLFPVGEIKVSPGAWGALSEAEDDPFHYVLRHQTGDWGEATANEVVANELGLAYQGRIRSTFSLATNTKIYVVTEADRSKTTVMRADEDVTSAPAK